MMTSWASSMTLTRRLMMLMCARVYGACSLFFLLLDAEHTQAQQPITRDHPHGVLLFLVIALGHFFRNMYFYFF